MTVMPRLTIGLPVYNGADLLPGTLDSLLAQTWGDFEIFVSDNGSTDRSVEVARAYAGTDPRVRVFAHDRNRGAAWNYNFTVWATHSELFKWAPHDDRYEPTYLERCVAALDADPTAVLAQARPVDVDVDGRVLKRWEPYARGTAPDVRRRFRSVATTWWHCLPIIGVIRRPILQQTGLIGSYESSDGVLLAELSLYGTFVELDEGLLLHTEHPGRSMRAHASRKTRGEWFDPELAGSVTFSKFRHARELAAAVHRARLPVATQLAIASDAPGWAWHWRSRLTREALGGLRDIARRRIAERRNANNREGARPDTHADAVHDPEVRSGSGSLGERARSTVPGLTGESTRERATPRGS
ncbi:glycosyltransferase family 2 protein [Egibacter rhizosphaerae]|nr:glycosyltransferase family 2 protein [Egibacter rhizosphaerae]